MNKYKPHIYVIPEDDSDRQIAEGFVLHAQVDTRRIQVMPVAGGWREVLCTFEEEYIQTLQQSACAHVVLLIDFDGHFPERLEEFRQAIPQDIAARVFILGPSQNPEALRRAVNMNFEAIGATLADDCSVDSADHWLHDHLAHNEPERLRLVQFVRPFLFTVGS